VKIKKIKKGTVPYPSSLAWEKFTEIKSPVPVNLTANVTSNKSHKPPKPPPIMSELRPPPTPIAMIIGTAIIAGITGYMIGMASSLGIFPNPFVTKEPKPRGIANYDDEEESAEEDIDESILDHAPNWANGLEADARDGLRARDTGASKKEKACMRG